MQFHLLGAATILAATLSSVLPAGAQSNELNILQEGNDNSLFVDQSEASNSQVGGLTIDETALQAPSLVAPGDVTVGSYSGLTFLEEGQAVQTGGNNQATVTLQGDGGRAYLFQQNTGLETNVATIDASDGASAAVGQIGTGNTATITVNGSFSAPLMANGTIIQTGDGNVGEITTSSDSAAVLIQNGSGNRQALDITGSAPGSTVVFTQNGNNLSPSAAAQVLTNALGTVSVTQTAIGGGGSVGIVGNVIVNQVGQ